MASQPGETTSGPVAIETVEELQDAIGTDDRVLAYFYADWCGPCSVAAPIVETVAATVETPVITVDVEALPIVAVDHSVRSIPTFIVYEHGVAAERMSGVHEAPALRATLED
jgi:thioredoxin 1